MSRDLGRDVPDLEKLYARKLWDDFSYPIYGPRIPWCPNNHRLFLMLRTTDSNWRYRILLQEETSPLQRQMCGKIGRESVEFCNHFGHNSIAGTGDLVILHQARKWHININFFVRLVLGRPRVCPGISPGLSLGQIRWKPGTNPGFLLILHSGSPISPGLSLGQTRFVPGTIPGTKGGTESLCEKSLCALFARYFRQSIWTIVVDKQRWAECLPASTDTKIWFPWTDFPDDVMVFYTTQLILLSVVRSPSAPNVLQYKIPLGPKLLHYITLLFRINFPDYVIIFYIAELVSNYFLGYVISCVVAEHTICASGYIT